MLDLFGITLPALLIMFIVVQALIRDRSEPWFQTLKSRDDAAAARPQPWRRGR